MKRGLGPGRLRRLRTGQWEADYRGADGRRHRQILSREKSVAERLLGELMRQRDLALAGLGTVEGQSRPLAEVREQYLAELKLRVSPSHFDNARRRTSYVLKCVGAQRVRDLVPYTVMQYRTRRVTGGTSHATVNAEVRILKAMLNWAVQAGLIERNPIGPMKHLPVHQRDIRRRRRALSDREIEAFLRASEEEDRLRAVPQTPLWRAFIETGARYHELTSARWADLDAAARTILLRAETTKSGKQRIVPLRDELLRDLLALKIAHGHVFGRSVNPREPIFLSPEGCPWPSSTRNTLRIFNRVLEAAGIPKHDEDGYTLDIHCLRHTTASRLGRAGVPLVHAQRILGHADPTITARIYTHLGVEELRGAVEQVPSISRSDLHAEVPYPGADHRRPGSQDRPGASAG